MAQYYGGARMVQHKADLAVCGGGHARATGRLGGGGRVTKVQLPSFRVKASVFRHSSRTLKTYANATTAAVATPGAPRCAVSAATKAAAPVRYI